jgi:hypothetical protein
VLAVAQFVVGVGLTLIALRIAQGKHVELSELIPPAQLLWRYFAATLLVGLIIGGVALIAILVSLAASSAFGSNLGVLFFGGLATFALAVYFSIRFSMVRFAILDGEEVVESLKRSTAMTQGHMWRILAFLVVIVLVNMLGAIAFLVGLLVTIPLTLIAYAHVYQKR